jgi:CBS domain containing-hemolysin-like protein
VTAVDILIAFVLVAANGFFVAAEFAITRVRPTQAEDWLEHGRPGAKSVASAVRHIDSYLAACQLGITLASLALGVIGERAFHEVFASILGDSAELAGIGIASAISFLLITMLHVTVGELAPKSAAIARTDPLVLMLAPPMHVFYLVTKPVVDLFNGVGNLILKPFGIPPASEAGHSPHTEDELRTLVRQSAGSGLIDEEEGRFTDNVFTFGDRRAREVMVPRPQVQFVTTAALGVELDEIHEATMSGFVIEQLGRMPLRGEHVALDGADLEVTRVGEARVEELRAKVADVTARAAAADEDAETR